MQTNSDLFVKPEELQEALAELRRQHPDWTNEDQQAMAVGQVRTRIYQKQRESQRHRQKIEQYGCICDGTEHRHCIDCKARLEFEPEAGRCPTCKRKCDIEDGLEGRATTEGCPNCRQGWIITDGKDRLEFSKCPCSKREFTIREAVWNKNIGLSAESFHWGCKDCREGWVPSDGEDGKIVLTRCFCQTKWKLPLLYRDASLRDFSDSVRKTANEWMDKPGFGLFLNGSTGVGKTRLAAALMIELTERHPWSQFVSASDMFRRVRECFHGKRSESDVLDELVRPSLLILDDIGAGGLSAFETRFLIDVLDKRLGEKRVTIATSNLKLQAISERMDDRIASRLSALTELGLTGPDRRQDI